MSYKPYSAKEMVPVEGFVVSRMQALFGFAKVSLGQTNQKSTSSMLKSRLTSRFEKFQSAPTPEFITYRVFMSERRRNRSRFPRINRERHWKSPGENGRNDY